jgi:glycosyltransferase involved in cell wall biosynthesis
MPHKKLSIVIPCYNEAATIDELLRRVFAAELGDWEKEVIIIDDASTDGTRDMLQKYAFSSKVIYREHNGGKGSAVRDGLAAATGSHMLLLDADLEYEPDDIQHLLRIIEEGEAEVVYGSRNLRPREREGAWIPRAGVWFISKLINGLWRIRLTDVWTCYKLFPMEARGDFKAGRFESELLFTTALARRGYRFAEVPIRYHPREVSEGKKIRIIDGLYAIVAVLHDWGRHAAAPSFSTLWSKITYRLKN